MGDRSYKQTNHLAVVGFLLPFAAAGIAAGLALWTRQDSGSMGFSIPYLLVVPAFLLAGLWSSIRSIPFIPEKNDEDYAYSGLTVNILFLFIYVLSLFYYFY